MGWKEEGQKVYERCNEEQRTFLDKKLRREADDLYEMETGRLRRLFALNQQPDSPVNNRLLVFTLIWQIFLKILSEELAPPEGNIRGVWYGKTDPLYTRHGLYEHGLMADDGYEAFLTRYSRQLGTVRMLDDSGAKVAYVTDLTEDALQAFVKLAIFKYAVFKFKDPNAGYRIIGEKAASRILTVEKQGLFDRFCEKYADKYKMSAFASEGEPSLLAAEHFARRLLQKKIRRVVIAALTDYDPWGFNIAFSLGEKLGYFGIEATTTHITSLGLWTAEVLRRQSYPLEFPEGSSHWEEVDRWFRETGGINGQKRAIHLNVADDAKVDRAVADWWKANKPTLAAVGI